MEIYIVSDRMMDLWEVMRGYLLLLPSFSHTDYKRCDRAQYNRQVQKIITIIVDSGETGDVGLGNMGLIIINHINGNWLSSASL